MIYSMTGYAVQTRDISHTERQGQGILHLELRTVNSRYLDIHFRIAETVRFAEPILRELFNTKLNRGKLECRLTLLPSSEATQEIQLNTPLLAQLKLVQNRVKESFPGAPPLTVNDILTWPAMLIEKNSATETLMAECVALGQTTLTELLATRQREGEKLGNMILQRVDCMHTLIKQAASTLPSVLGDYQTRLITRLREALDQSSEERIQQEMSLFAIRIDVAEELSRLTAHLDEVKRVIQHGGAVGKRLDFLMQELNREANTLASKSVSAEISGIAIELKLLIEQIREQVQNIE